MDQLLAATCYSLGFKIPEREGEEARMTFRQAPDAWYLPWVTQSLAIRLHFRFTGLEKRTIRGQVRMDRRGQLKALQPTDVAILCDFDGTISRAETLGLLFRKFAASGMKHAERWQRGEIDMREEIRATFSTVTASKTEMEEALDEVDIETGFLDLYDYGRRAGYSFFIVSDGLEWYIDYILKRYGISDIPIFANRILFEDGGFRFEFPWFDDETPRRGVCKPLIARACRVQCEKLVYIGDGRSDIEIVHEADVVFARSWLAGYCYAKGLHAVEFHDWDELLIKWKESCGL
jgi:2-hydroxy-3-keto-5-methylthiopentenyl-1-phosphate phosphatase